MYIAEYFLVYLILSTREEEQKCTFFSTVYLKIGPPVLWSTSSDIFLFLGHNRVQKSRSAQCFFTLKGKIRYLILSINWPFSINFLPFRNKNRGCTCTPGTPSSNSPNLVRISTYFRGGSRALTGWVHF